MQVGTVVTKYVADAASHLKTVAAMTAASVRQTNAIKGTHRAFLDFSRDLITVSTISKIVKSDMEKLTGRHNDQAKAVNQAGKATQQYTRGINEARGATAAYTGEARKASEVTKGLFDAATMGAAIGGITIGVNKLRAFALASMKAAAEVETLDTVLGQMGSRAGYSIGYLRDQVDELRKSGIEAAASSRGITDFLKTGLPLGKIKELSRLAQDLAVVGGSNSTESFQRVMWGITTGQTEVLRTAGLNVSFETAYRKAATEANKSVDSLTAQEKIQARLNEVLSQAPTVAGAYESALKTAGKQLSSMPRLIDDVRVALGTTLLPVFQKAIFATNDWLKALRHLIEDGPLGTWIARQAQTVAKGIEFVSDKIKNLLTGTNLTPALAGIEKLSHAISSLGHIGLAGLLGGFSSLLAQLPIIGRLLAPLSGWQVAIITFIASSENLRKAVMEVMHSVYQAAVRISAAFVPALKDVGLVADSSAGPIASLAHAIARQIDIYSTLAATLIRDAAPAILGLAAAVKALYGLISLNPFGMFIKSLLGFIAHSQNARIALVSLYLAVRAFSSYLVSGLKFAALISAIDGIRRSMSFVSGDLNAFNGFLNDTTSRMKGAAVAAGIYAVAILGITLALQQMAKWQADANKKYATMFETAKDAGGAAQTMKMMNTEMAALSQRVNKTNHEVLLFADSNNKLVRTFDLLSSAVPGAQGFKNLLKGEFKPKALLDSYKTDLDVKAFREAQKNFLDELKTGWMNLRDNITSETAKAVQELQSSKEAITKAVGNFGVEEGTLDRLSPGMLKALDDTLAQIDQEVSSWASDYTSVGQAMLDKEVKGWDDLMAFYDRQLQRTAEFFAGLDVLKSFGAPQSLIDELLKGGAEKYGKAMHEFLVQASTMPPEAVQAMVATVGNQKKMADDIVEYNKQKYARMTLDSVEYQKQLQAEAEQQQKTFDNLATSQLSGLDQMEQGYNALAIAFRTSGKANKDQQQAMDSLMSSLTSQLGVAREAVKAGTAIDATGIQQTLDKILALLPENLVSYGLSAMQGLNAVVASNGQLVDIAGQLGMAAGAVFANSMKNAALAGLRSVQQFAAAQLQQQTSQQVLSQIGSGQNPYPEEDQTAQKAADQAEKAAKAIEDVFKSHPPLKLFGEAMDEVWGKQMRFVSAMHSMADESEGLAKSLYEIAGSNDSSAKKQQGVEKAVMSAVKAIREEVEAMADLGMIGNSVEAMTAETAKRIEELKKTLPGLVSGLGDVAGGFKTVEEVLTSVHDAINKTLGKFMDAQEATYAVEEQVASLSQAYADQQDLLTNGALSEKDVRTLKRATNKELIASVKAIQAEAKALAANGKIGADAASQTEFMNAELAKLRDQFPALIPQIDEYSKLLDAVPEEVKTQTELEVAAAMQALDGWKQALAQVPAVASTLLQIAVDDAALRTATDKANEFNGVRLWDAGLESGIAKDMWSQAAALQNQVQTTNSPGWAGRVLAAGVSAIAAAVQDSLLRQFPGGMGRVMDTGGMLHPGFTPVYNKTGKDEYVFTPDQVRSLHLMGMKAAAAAGAAGDGGGVTIDKLVVQTTEPAKNYLQEGLWKAMRGFGFGHYGEDN